MGGPAKVREWLAWQADQQLTPPNLINPSPPQSESGISPAEPHHASPESIPSERSAKNIDYLAQVCCYPGDFILYKVDRVIRRAKPAENQESIRYWKYEFAAVTGAATNNMLAGIDQNQVAPAKVVVESEVYFDYMEGKGSANLSPQQDNDDSQDSYSAEDNQSSGVPSNMTDLIYNGPGDMDINSFQFQEQSTEDDNYEEQFSASVYGGSQHNLEDDYNGPPPNLLFRADNVLQHRLSEIETLPSGLLAKVPEQDPENPDLVILPLKPRLKYPTRPPTPELPSRALPDPNRILTFPNGTTYTGFQIDRFTMAQFLRENHLDEPFNQVCKWVEYNRCARNNGTEEQCEEMIHFKRRFNEVTNIRLGDCSYLGSCYNKDTCPYVHYDMIPAKKPLTIAERAIQGIIPEESRELLKTVGEGDVLRGMKRCKAGVWTGCVSPRQWINIDVTVIPMDVLGGDFGAVMMDPPWPIHMRLPYRQMSDEDIMNLEIEKLTKNGVIFLWVTSRVFSIGVKCLEKWGYKLTDTILWVKTNQLGGTIATGRTGHWLNHMQETCLVGIKGTPTLLAGTNGNVLVEKVRETSRKPEGIYEIIEALVGPYCPKAEIFGRQHNIRNGWLTVGNQLPSTYIHDIRIHNRLLGFARTCRARKVRLNPPIFFQPPDADRDEYAKQYYLQRQMEASMPTDLEECRNIAKEAFAEADGDTFDIATFTEEQVQSVEKAKEALAKFLVESRLFFPPQEWKTQPPPSIPQLPEIAQGASPRSRNCSHIPALLASVKTAVDPTAAPSAAPGQPPLTDNTPTNNRANRRHANREKKKTESKRVVSNPQPPTGVPVTTRANIGGIPRGDHNIPRSQTTQAIQNPQGATSLNPQANAYVPPGSNASQSGSQVQQPRGKKNRGNGRQPMQVHQWTPTGKAMEFGTPLAAPPSLPWTYTTPSGLQITQYPFPAPGAQYPFSQPVSQHLPQPTYPQSRGGFNATDNGISRSMTQGSIPSAQAQVPPPRPIWMPTSPAPPHFYTFLNQTHGHLGQFGPVGLPQFGPSGPSGQFGNNGHGYHGNHGNQEHHGQRGNRSGNGMRRSETQNQNQNSFHNNQTLNSGMNRSQTHASIPGNHQGNHHGNHDHNQRGRERGQYQGRQNQRAPPGMSLLEATRRHQLHQPGYHNGWYAAPTAQQARPAQPVRVQSVQVQPTQAQQEQTGGMDYNYQEEEFYPGN